MSSEAGVEAVEVEVSPGRAAVERLVGAINKRLEKDVDVVIEQQTVECIPDPDDGDSWLEGVEVSGHWFADEQEKCKCGGKTLAELMLAGVGQDVEAEPETEPEPTNVEKLAAWSTTPEGQARWTEVVEQMESDADAEEQALYCMQRIAGEDACVRHVNHKGAHCPDHNADLSSGDRFWFDGDLEMRRMGETSGFSFSPDYMEVAPWDSRLAVFVGKGQTIEAARVLPNDEVEPEIGMKEATAGRGVYNVLLAQRTGNGWVSPDVATKFATVVADPPWEYGDKLPGKGRGAAKQYSTMSYAEIAQFPATLGKDVAFAADCRLFLWTTATHLQEALDVMKAWGFRYVTNLVWAKKPAKNDLPWFGMGRTVRASHEQVLIGVRGKPEVRSKSVRSVFEAAVGKHSEKPEEFYRLVEELSPGPYLELFARKHRGPGWLCLGDELVNEGGEE